MGYIENGTEIAKKLNKQYGWARNPIVSYLPSRSPTSIRPPFRADKETGILA